MDPGDALGVAAQAGAALAGFAGVVVAFRTRALHEWSTVDKFRLRLLLGNSVFPFIYCLVGILLLFIPGLNGTWRWASGFTLVPAFGFGIYMRNAFRSIPAGEIPSDAFTKWVFYPLAIAAWVFTFLQIYNAIFLGAFWPFFSAIVLQLIAAVIQFVRLILLTHGG